MPRSPDMASLHGVHKALLNAEQAGRTGGALYVKDDACAYRAVDDFPDERFRAHLSQMIAAGGALYFFVVEEREALADADRLALVAQREAAELRRRLEGLDAHLGRRREEEGGVRRAGRGLGRRGHGARRGSAGVATV